MAQKVMFLDDNSILTRPSTLGTPLDDRGQQDEHFIHLSEPMKMAPFSRNVSSTNLEEKEGAITREGMFRIWRKRR